MSALDMQTVAVLTTLVIAVCAILFLSETLLRHDEGAGRLWAVGFLAAMLTSLAYLVWAYTPGAWWPLAVGNTTFVIGTGSMWLGARRFNGARMAVASALVGLGAAGAFVAVAWAGPEGGDWAGAPWMFGALLLLAAAGSIECFRGRMRAARTAWVLGVVLGVQALYYVGRIVAFAAGGPEGVVFREWFGAVQTGVLSIVLTIVGVVVTSVLRATSAQLRGVIPMSGPAIDGILSRDDAPVMLARTAGVALGRGETIAMTAVRIADLDQIRFAFGPDVVEHIVAACRRGARGGAPTFAILGEDVDDAGLLLLAPALDAADARRQASRLHGIVLDHLERPEGGVVPLVGVGVALSTSVGYDCDVLASIARDAARRSATTVETAVVVV